MANGLFNLKQVMQGIQQGGWPNQVGGSTFGARFAGSGSGQYLTGPTTGALNFSTGAFTVEFWAFINAYGGGSLTIMFSASNASADFQIGVSDGNGVYWHNSGVQLTSPNTGKPLGKWVHLALVRSGTTASLFCNGVRASTTTNSAAINLTNFNIGSYQASPSAYMTQGWISNLRITNTAVYDPTATTLTLPLSPLTAISGTQLLTLQDATIVDNSTNGLTITNNGSVGMQSVAPFGLSNYTPPAIEYLVVAGGGGGGAYYGAGGGAGGLLTGIDPIPNSQTLLVTVGGGGTGASGAGTGTNGSASVFGQISAAGGGGGAGGSASSVKNGLAGGSGGGGQNYDAGGATANGGAGIFGQGNAGSSGVGGGGGGAGTVGYRAGNVTKSGGGGAGIVTTIGGTATAYAGGGSGAGGSIPGGVGGGGAANVAGTANTGGGGGGDSGSNGGSGIVVVSYPDVYAAASATTGSPTVSTSGSGSISFNGSSAIAYSANSLNIRTNSFTFEGWFNFSSTSGTIGLFGSAGANTFYISYLSGNLYVGDGSTNTITYPYTISTGTWYSIAVSFDGTSYRLFVNGSLLTTSTTLLANTTLTNLSIANYNSTNYFTGYVSNARYVKGTAVYTSTYTVSTIPLTAITNTSLLLNTVSGAYLADGSTNSFAVTATGSPTWNALSPFTGTGYKNRVYTWTSSGTITF